MPFSTYWGCTRCAGLTMIKKKSYCQKSLEFCFEFLQNEFKRLLQLISIKCIFNPTSLYSLILDFSTNITSSNKLSVRQSRKTPHKLEHRSNMNEHEWNTNEYRRNTSETEWNTNGIRVNTDGTRMSKSGHRCNTSEHQWNTKGNRANSGSIRRPRALKSGSWNSTFQREFEFVVVERYEMKLPIFFSLIVIESVSSDVGNKTRTTLKVGSHDPIFNEILRNQ